MKNFHTTQPRDVIKVGKALFGLWIITDEDPG